MPPMSGPEEEREEERARPRVVDKRVSSGGHNPTPRPTPPSPEPTPAPAPTPSAETPDRPAAGPGRAGGEQPVWTPEEEAQARAMAQEIAERPSIDWVVNAAVTLANVAATKIQIGDPADAQLAIDSLDGLLKSAAGRLQDAEAPLKQTLAQLQLAYAERVAAPPATP